MLNWKDEAIAAAQAKAVDAELTRQEKLNRRKEQARITFSKYLTNCGVPFTENDIQFEIMDHDNIRTFVVIDGIEFSTRKSEFEYEGCGVVRTCEKCGNRLTSYTFNNPADLGKELIEPRTPYHRCDPLATKDETAEPETTATRLLNALRD